MKGNLGREVRGHGKFGENHPLIQFGSIALTAFALGGGLATWIMLQWYVPQQLFVLQKQLDVYETTKKPAPAERSSAPPESERTKTAQNATPAPLSVEAMSAVQFALKFEAMSEGQQNEFKKSLKPQSVVWELQLVTDGGYDRDGKVTALCLPRIGGRWSAKEVNPVDVIAGEHYEDVLLRLKSGNVIKVKGTLKWGLLFPEVTGDIDLVTR
jgi:hypothetical protein